MTDFVLNRYRFWTNDDDPDCQSTARYIFSTKKYAEFLKKPLTLGMFVPCDKNGIPLKMPNTTVFQDAHFDVDEMNNYNEAKEKVLFKDCEVREIKSDKNYFVLYHKSRQIWVSWTDRIIEDFILNRSYLSGLELTESALKQIGINQ